MRRLLGNLFLLFVLTLYTASLLGMLFINHAFMFFGIVAFLLMFLVSVLTQGFQKRQLRLKRVWLVIAPLFVALFVTTIVLSRGLGAPQTENESVFAKRDKYRFTRGGEVSRGRFIAVSVCSTLAWHLLAIGFAAEQWASFRATDTWALKVTSRPTKRKSGG